MDKRLREEDPLVGGEALEDGTTFLYHLYPFYFMNFLRGKQSTP